MAQPDTTKTIYVPVSLISRKLIVYGFQILIPSLFAFCIPVAEFATNRNFFKASSHLIDGGLVLLAMVLMFSTYADLTNANKINRNLVTASGSCFVCGVFGAMLVGAIVISYLVFEIWFTQLLAQGNGTYKISSTVVSVLYYFYAVFCCNRAYTKSGALKRAV